MVGDDNGKLLDTEGLSELIVAVEGLSVVLWSFGGGSGETSVRGVLNEEGEGAGEQSDTGNSGGDVCKSLVEGRVLSTVSLRGAGCTEKKKR